MHARTPLPGATLVAALAVMIAGPASGAQGRAGASAWTPPRTPWGHPDLSGIYTNKDEANTPLERPKELEGRSLKDFGTAEIAALNRERQSAAQQIAPGIGGAETGAGPTHWYDHLQARGSQPWFITDPPEGRLPPMTPEAQRREAAAALLNSARNDEGRADSVEDRSLYDRCITRGIPGSMMPAIYGNAYEILQTPDSVVIRYEMIHETRVIPLDGRPRLGRAVRQYLGDARGRWDGTTLVVETTNFTEKTHFGYNNRYNSDRLRLVERFTPVAPGTLRWEVTVDDPATWTRPWTFAMPLTRDESQPIFEYACHEGNRGLVNILTGARAEEAAARKQ
jgi:hypothetical protein